jgi:hypothetical protein
MDRTRCAAGDDCGCCGRRADDHGDAVLGRSRMALDAPVRPCAATTPGEGGATGLAAAIALEPAWARAEATLREPSGAARGECLWPITSRFITDCTTSCKKGLCNSCGAPISPALSLGDGGGGGRATGGAWVRGEASAGGRAGSSDVAGRRECGAGVEEAAVRGRGTFVCGRERGTLMGN